MSQRLEMAEMRSRLSLNTRGFTSGLNIAATSLSTFTGLAGRAVSQIASIGSRVAGLGTLIAGGGLTLLARQQVQVVDSNAKMAAALNVATENMAALRLSTKLTGADFNNLARRIQRMNATVGNAAQGNIGAARTFRALGMSISSLLRLNTEQRLGAITDRLRQIPNVAVRSSVAAQIFGRNLHNISNLLALGSRGLNENAILAQRFGTAISNLDASKIENARDKLTEVREVINGLVTRVLVRLSPAMVALGDRFVAWATKGEGAVHLVDGAIIGVSNTVDNLIHKIKQLGAVSTVIWDEITKSVSAAGNIFDHSPLMRFARDVKDGFLFIPRTVGGALGRGIGSIMNRLGIDPVGDVTREVDVITNKINNAISSVGDAPPSGTGPVTSFLVGASAEADTFAAHIARAREEMNRLFSDPPDGGMGIIDVERLERMERAAQQLHNNTRTPLERFKQNIGEINELFREGMIGAETRARAIRMEYQNLLKQVEPLMRGVDSLSSGAARATADFKQLSEMPMFQRGPGGATVFDPAASHRQAVSEFHGIESRLDNIRNLLQTLVHNRQLAAVAFS